MTEHALPSATSLAIGFFQLLRARLPPTISSSHFLGSLPGCEILCSENSDLTTGRKAVSLWSGSKEVSQGQRPALEAQLPLGGACLPGHICLRATAPWTSANRGLRASGSPEGCLHNPTEGRHSMPHRTVLQPENPPG